MPQLQQINPFIRYCKIWPQLALHTASVTAYDCRIFYVLAGNGCFYLGDRQYPFHPATLVFIPSGVPYRFTYPSSEAVQFLLINFDLVSENTHIINPMPPDTIANFRLVQMIPAPDSVSQAIPFVTYDFHECRQDLLSIDRLFINRTPLYAELSSAILKKILIQLISRQYAESISSGKQLSEAVLAYVRRHYSEALTNEAIAAHFGFHPYYLNRTVKAHTGQSLHQYLIDYRIAEAKHLLTTSSLPIHNIAIVTGFSTASLFSATFKKHTGQSPAEYRKQHFCYI